jgi:hypothetical protein
MTQVIPIQMLQAARQLTPTVATAQAAATHAIPSATHAPQNVLAQAARSPVGAATRKATIWGIAAAGIALFSLTHPLTWPIAAVAGYFSYKNIKMARALKALV